MAVTEYLIRRKVFALLGAQFHVYDPSNQLIGYCKQKAFKLKEDIRLYTDESMAKERLSIQARSILDFSAAYDISDSLTGTQLGALKRKGWTSMIRDSWIVMDPSGEEIGKIEEDSMGMALLRRFLSNWIPQSFHLVDNEGLELATFHQQFNPFIFKMTVKVDPKCPLNPLMVLASGLLLAAIEGRQEG